MRHRLAAPLLLLIASAAAPAGRQPALRTVALHGQPAPGFGDPQIVFKSFQPPSLSQSEFVVFTGTVGTAAQPFLSNVIYRWSEAGGLVRVAREGIQAVTNPELGTVDIAFLTSDARVDEAGRVAFFAQLAGSQNAYFLWEAGALTLLARPGAPMKIHGHHATTGAPISVVGNLVLGFGFGEGAAFHSGKLVFRASLNAGVYEGIWTADATHTCVDTSPALPSDPVENSCVNLLNDIMDAPDGPPPPPNPPGRPRFTSFGSVARNPVGTMAAIAYFNTAQGEIGLYRFADDGTPEFIERGNKPFAANPTHLGTTLSGRIGFQGGYYPGGDPQDGNPAHVGVHAEFSFGGLRQVYRAFTTGAPGIADAKLGNPLSSGFDDSGLAVFAADIDKPGDPLHGRNGVWREIPPGIPKLVAHEGQTVPAAIAGGDPTFQRLYTAHLNRLGQLALFLQKEGPGIGGANDTAIWTITSLGAFVETIAEGQIVQLEDASLRTIAAFVPLGGVTASNTLVSGPGSEGRASALSDQGNLALRIDFLDATSGVFLLELGTYEPLAPPRLVGLEVIQTIQDWRNSVALVAGKRTFVRGHLESNDIAIVAPQLLGRRAGASLPGSPLTPANFNGSVITVTDALSARDELDTTPYFELPESWTNGQIELELQLAGVGLDCQEAAPPTPHDCSATVDFTPAARPDVRFVNVVHESAGQLVAASDALVAELGERLIAALPTAGLVRSVVRMGWSGPAAPDPHDVARALDWMRIWDRCLPAAGCGRIYYGVILDDSGSGADGFAVDIPGSAAAGRVSSYPKRVGRLTHVHEIGHLLGRVHAVKEAFGIYVPIAPLEMKVGACCEQSARATSADFSNFQALGGSDPVCSFPFSPQTGGELPALGPMSGDVDAQIWGLDSRQMLAVDPLVVFDLMSYCSSSPIDTWPSDVTYAALRQAIASRFPASFDGPPPSSIVAGVPHLGVRGTVDYAASTVALEPVARFPDLPPPGAPPSGPLLLRLRDGGGALLQEIPFRATYWPESGTGGDASGSFQLLVADDPAIRALEIVLDGAIAATAAASAHPPTVAVLFPDGGETLTAPEVTILWDGVDLDADPLTYVVQYSGDDGTTWSTLAVDHPAEALTVPRSALPGSAAGRVRVQASDGFDTATDASDGSFSVANSAPRVWIASPLLNPIFSGGQLLRFAAGALDPEQGELAPAAFAWSSSLDGALATGDRFELAASALSAGTHWITVTATDAEGAAATAAIEIHVDVPGLFFADGFEADLAAWSAVTP